MSGHEEWRAAPAWPKGESAAGPAAAGVGERSSGGSAALCRTPPRGQPSREGGRRRRSRQGAHRGCSLSGGWLSALMAVLALCYRPALPALSALPALRAHTGVVARARASWGQQARLSMHDVRPSTLGRSGVPSKMHALDSHTPHEDTDRTRLPVRARAPHGSPRTCMPAFDAAQTATLSFCLSRALRHRRRRHVPLRRSCRCWCFLPRRFKGPPAVMPRLGTTLVGPFWGRSGGALPF